MAEVDRILTDLNHFADPTKILGRAHFGIPEVNSIGLSMPQLRKYAGSLERNQALADELWKRPEHEIKILATLVAEPHSFTLEKIDAWVEHLYSWDICDQFCMNVLVKVPDCMQLPIRWAMAEGEFQKRAAFALIAVMAVHLKSLPNEDFLAFKPLLKPAAEDPRNFVKKAVNWAIRQIGKRNPQLREAMQSFCEELLLLNQSSASWIARDALREFKLKAQAS